MTKFLLQCDCINGSKVFGVREPILYSFALDEPPCHIIYKEPKLKLFKRMNKSVLSPFTLYIEDVDDKPVDFNGEKVCCTCQLIEFNKYMNLNRIRPKNGTEDLLFSISKNCETLIEQTHRKAEETFDLKHNKSRETFSFKPPISIEGP